MSSIRRHSFASSISSPSVGSKCHACAVDTAELEPLRLNENLDDILDSQWATGICCCASGGGDEQGVIASSSSLNEALAVIDRRPNMLDRCEAMRADEWDIVMGKSSVYI